MSAAENKDKKYVDFHLNISTLELLHLQKQKKRKGVG
jgi:hypothetical protein